MQQFQLSECCCIITNIVLLAIAGSCRVQDGDRRKLAKRRTILTSGVFDWKWFYLFFSAKKRLWTWQRCSLFCLCFTCSPWTSPPLFWRERQETHTFVSKVRKWPRGGAGTHTLPFIRSYQCWPGAHGCGRTHGNKCTTQSTKAPLPNGVLALARHACTCTRAHNTADNGFLDAVAVCCRDARRGEKSRRGRNAAVKTSFALCSMQWKRKKKKKVVATQKW